MGFHRNPIGGQGASAAGRWARRLLRLLLVMMVLAMVLTAAAPWWIARWVPPAWGAAAVLRPARKAMVEPLPAGAEAVVFGPPDLRLRGWRFTAQGQPVGSLVFLHGVAANRLAGLHVAKRYARHGITTLIYDGRGHGQSDGDMCSYGVREREDLLEALALLPAGPVVLMGSSLGAAVALQAAPQVPNLAGVVSMATFSDLRTVVADRKPWFLTDHFVARALREVERIGGFRIDDASPVGAASRIRAPVLMIHGAADRETPPAHSRRVYAALRGERELWLVPGRDHDDGLPADVWRRIDDWVMAHLATAQR